MLDLFGLVRLTAGFTFMSDAALAGNGPIASHLEEANKSDINDGRLSSSIPCVLCKDDS